MNSLKGKSLLTLKDYSQEEILYLIDLAIELKAKKKAGIKGELLSGKNIALIFEKPSTRTRCAFVVGCTDEGAYPEYLGEKDIQLGHKESVEDTARVLGRVFEGIEFRGYSQDTVEKLAKYSGVPVWNGLTDLYHPTQILADLMTIKEIYGKLKGVRMAYVGDGRNNMANSLIVGCAKVGLDFHIIAPKELWPSDELLEACKPYQDISGAKITLSKEVSDVKDMDVIYTDVWCSMGEEDKASERIKLLKKYQVNAELIKLTGKDNSVVMHCLPAVKGNEVTKAVFEEHADTIFEQAENRMHTIKAVMVASLCDL